MPLKFSNPLIVPLSERNAQEGAIPRFLPFPEGTPDDMPEVPVSSSHLKSVKYNPSKKTLIVKFKDNTRYEYTGVSESEYTGLIAAKSVGSYFHAKIKPKSYRRIS
jgi:hypothetical protein